MKKYLLMFAAAVLIAGCTKKPAEQKPEEQMPPQEQVTDGNAYKDITALTPEGTELSLSSVVGKSDYVLLDFWASWCGPCRRFVPVLKDFYARFGGERLQILSCSVDQDEAAWREALKEEQMPWLQMREDEAHPCSDLYGVQYIPHIVLIDREGRIVAVNPEEPELEAILLGE
ncbi:MAG: TlpA family protein disulfide reductase [Paludibacteraceae bacterium]|nr:TlpA family protein disulfide reductase [Paludibacteraceae bacterium]